MKPLILLIIFVIFMENYVNAFEMDVGSSATISGPTVEPGSGGSSGSGGGGGGGGRQRIIEINKTENSTTILMNNTKVLDFRLRNSFAFLPRNKLVVLLILKDGNTKQAKILDLNEDYLAFYVESIGVNRISSSLSYIDVFGYNLNISYDKYMRISLVEQEKQIETPAILEKYAYNASGVFLILVLVLLIALYVYFEAKRFKILK